MKDAPAGPPNQPRTYCVGGQDATAAQTCVHQRFDERTGQYVAEGEWFEQPAAIHRFEAPLAVIRDALSSTVERYKTDMSRLLPQISGDAASLHEDTTNYTAAAQRARAIAGRTATQALLQSVVESSHLAGGAHLPSLSHGPTNGNYAPDQCHDRDGQLRRTGWHIETYESGGVQKVRWAC